MSIKSRNTSFEAARRALVFGASCATLSVAHAQQQPVAANENASAPLEEVVITGSYIPRTNKETSSPVQTITAEEIQATGYSTIADVVRSISADNSGTLPTAFPGAFAAGASGVALRGLTVNSTLVLIDGLRAASYALPDDGERSFVDLNSIQLGTIDRVEVLKDGASSVYGADAIGGVVNVILKKQFQGFAGSAEVGDAQHGGGFEKRAEFTIGHGDLASDHFNVYLSVEYEHDNAIPVGDRGFPFNSNDESYFGGANNHPQPALGSGSIYGSVTPGTLPAN